MKLKIIPNPKKTWAKELAAELKAFLTPAHTFVRSGADATICIGGDGTILYAHYKGRLDGAVLGIGGDKSYICQLRKDNWKGGISGILAGGRRESISTLVCTLGQRNLAALNDAVIHATHYRVAEMDVAIGEGSAEHKAQFEGDGMIISTALGSAAYAYSAGGEKIAPTESKLSLVPICPYKRAFSPKVLSEDSSITVTVGNDCAFIIDGIFVRRLRKGEAVGIKKGPALAFFEGVGKHY
jgi:NAD+ kinase